MPEVDSNGVLQSVNAENCVDKSIYKSTSRLEEIHDERKCDVHLCELLFDRKTYLMFSK